MQITLKRNYGINLIFEAENVRIEEDIEERFYPKDENGKTIFNNPKRDVSTNAIEQFISVLDDMIHYRKAKFDSSDLIKNLFEKLPEEKIQQLLKDLNDCYEIE